MKIGILIDQLIYGGVQKTAIEEARNLNQLGHEACLLVLMREGSEYFDKKDVSGVKVRFLSDDYPLFFKRSFKFPIFSFLSSLYLLSPFLAPWHVKKREFDIVVSHGTTTCFTAQALWRVKKIPFVAIIHDPMLYILNKVYSRTALKHFFPVIAPLLIFLERSFVRDSLVALTGSHVHSEFLKETDRVTPQVLYYGCHPLAAIPKKRGRYLLANSRWEEEKNPSFLLNLLKAIPKSKLKIAGSWTKNQDYQKFLSQIKKAGLEKRVEIIPSFKEKDSPLLFASARVLVHPHFEAFGIGGLEAASHGCPLIFPAGSGVSELFEHQVHGFFPKKTAVKDYKKFIKKLLDDERLAWQMGKTAWEKVKKNYTWKAHTLNLVQIIKSAFKKRSHPINLAVIEIGHLIGPGLSGGDKLFEAMAQTLPKKYEITVIASSFGTRHWQDSGLKVKLVGLKPNRFDQNGGPVPVFLTYMIRMFNSFRELTRLAKTKIVYSSTNILPDVAPAFFLKLLRPKVVWIARIHHLIPPPHKRVGRATVNVVSYLMQKTALFMIRTRANAVLALNQNLYQKLKGSGFNKNKVKLLGAGIEFNKIAAAPVLEKTPAFEGVFLGRLHPTKGIFDLVNIWKQVSKGLPKAKLAIIGDGPESIKRDLEQKIQGANLSSQISLLGFVPEKEKLSLLKKARVFLFTDHEAGWGLAAAEAMACGLPVVGYDVGFVSGVYRKGFVGIPLKNTAAFGKKVAEFLKNEGKRKEIAEDAHKQAQELDWKNTTSAFVKILETLIQKGT